MVEKEKDFLLFNYARESLARARARPPFQKEKKKNNAGGLPYQGEPLPSALL
jgi:hypothetical protein